MSFTLRPYQDAAVSAALGHMRSSVEPACIVAATGAGKSLIIAAIAEAIHGRSGKRVLCLAPSAELVKQNRAKYLATGQPASIYSASAGGRCLRHPVVFGTPGTVVGAIDRIADKLAMIVVDECHGLTATVLKIIDAARAANPNIRVLGLTATPYRLGSGYIFREWPDGRVNTDETSRDPYFARCVIEIAARDLIEQGYLTPPVLGEVGVDGYDTGGLELNRSGNFDAAAVDRAYHGHGRKTAAIVGDVVARSAGRRGVMLFAATVQHAEEVMASLPPGLSAIVTGATKKRERERILAAFLAQRIKYIVNVAVLTTGFDAPHVDVIAILRKTESVGLLQQIIGRGLRLFAGKGDCLILDYTTNIEDHCPDGDVFSPRIRAGAASAGGGIEVTCPSCATPQTFSARKEYIGFPYDQAGYALDLDGNLIGSGEGPIPVHHGRRCFGMVPGRDRGKLERCWYRWTGKECEACGADNDIAARRCRECGAEIVDPNERLRAEFKAAKRDPHNRQTDEVLDMRVSHGTSKGGNPIVRVDWTTPYRSFPVWYMKDGGPPAARRQYADLMAATGELADRPETITYQKDRASGYFRAVGYNAQADTDPTTQE